MATKKTEMKEADNLSIYESLRNVPKQAQKTINGGRLNGKTDINPMWRIKAMTDTFGPCGIGWRYVITKQWTESYGDEVKAFTNIDLYIKVNGEWSEAIPGTGGASAVEVNRNGIYVNDEAYKMSLTDALSVSMKALGVAADIYYANDAAYGTKYEVKANAASQQVSNPQRVVVAAQAAASNTLAQAKEDEYIVKVKSASTTDEINAIYTSAPAAYQKSSSRLYAACVSRSMELAQSA
jgi:hypothetical protein